MGIITNIARLFIGTKHEREMKKLSPLVDKVNSFEPGLKKLSDAQLRGKTAEFRQRIANGESLDSLIPEAFAVVREASTRTLLMRHFDVQLVGGMILHEGKIAEMRTGEGKTLVATLPVYLNALTGKGVHVITVNDYLAKRDAEWMGNIYRFLGMDFGCIVHGLDDPQRRKQYAADVTYGTNNEFGFDYLRDNMKFRLEDYVQREFNYAIVDEVDSILIDEARTPLIISGPTEESTDKYYIINRVIPLLGKDVDYTVDEKTRTSSLTDAGMGKVESILKVKNLYDPSQIETLHHIHQALKAHTLFKLDIDYVVQEGKVVIVDEFTGRLMPGRRFSDGLHQALEAKEAVRIENENQTLATITFQNYFRMYPKLAGMTGTAETEAGEFFEIYKLDVVVIPTDKPMIRNDNADMIYKVEEEKFKAVIREIQELHKINRPVLVGTISIEKSEVLSGMLKRQGLKHNVLNAKHHAREAEIVSQAGQPGSITISTNMAGRGTDIVLGPGVREAGGLHILGTERHEARRIDNQLRGRAGRQGDPGSSRFYLSLDDDLMRIFGSERIAKIMDTLKIPADEPIEHRMISRAIENAQKKVEGRNFDIRKHLLEYDNVMNTQRDVIYTLRKDVLKGDHLRDLIIDMIDELVNDICFSFAPPKSLPKEWDEKEIADAMLQDFNIHLQISEEEWKNFTSETLHKYLKEKAIEKYEAKEKEFGTTVARDLEKMLILQAIDALWKDHLLGIDHLKEGIGLRGYAQKDPLLEYKREAFELFKDLNHRITQGVVQRLLRVQLASPEEALEQQERA
ncbi:MAG TPA: preprotein translocase subunit SecA, partial [Bdellovibrionota bacterium]|nr:preprotein translocase subunit SecA [Bdellovibrionota bacterium]